MLRWGPFTVQGRKTMIEKVEKTVKGWQFVDTEINPSQLVLKIDHFLPDNCIAAKTSSKVASKLMSTY